MESKRRVRRKDISPEGILLGHEVKNFMTVIQLRMGSYQILGNLRRMQKTYSEFRETGPSAGLFLYFATFLTKKVSKRIMNVGGK